MNEALVLLILVWAVLLLPSAVRSRTGSPHATVGGFTHAMNVLRSDRHHHREMLVPSAADRIVEREVDRSPHPITVRHEDPIVAERRRWFLSGVAATAATFVLAVAIGGWVWTVFVLVGAITGGYTALLRQLKLQRDEARAVVAELDLYRQQPREQRVPAAVGDEARSGGPRGDETWSGRCVRLRRFDG